MPYLLSYRYQEWETLLYRQTVQMVASSADPEGPTEEKLLEGESLHRVLQADPERGWLIERTGLSGTGQFWMDPQGGIDPSRGRMTRLSPNPVEVGDSWEVRESDTLTWTYTLKRIEVDEEGEEGGETLAIMSSRAESAEVDKGGAHYTLRVQGAHIFSVEAGHQVYARIVTSMTWDDGRSSQAITELELEERT